MMTRTTKKAMMTKAQITKMAPFKPGEAVLIHGDWSDCHSAVDRIRKAQFPPDAAMGADGRIFEVPLIVLGPATLEVADESRMNKAGWYRK
jgi:hypothetical protein